MANRNHITPTEYITKLQRLIALSYAIDRFCPSWMYRTRLRTYWLVFVAKERTVAQGVNE